MPAFNRAIFEVGDKVLYEHAVTEKGQYLYEDIRKAKKAIEIERIQKEGTQASRTKNKTLDNPDRTLGN